MIWIGALLMVAGIVVMALQPLRRGQLSGERLAPGNAADTLEPRRPSRGFGFRWNWPGIVLFALGAVLLLATAVFGV